MKNINININIKAFLPYIVAGTTVVVANRLIGNGYPFYLDKEKYNYEAEIYNHDDPAITKIYKGPIPEYDYIYLYSKWELNNDGGYDRKVLKYAVYDIDPEEAIDILSFGNLDAQDILGEPDGERIQHKNRLDKFELEVNQELYKYVHYKEKENIVTETRSHDLLVILKEIIETSIISTSYYTYKILKKDS